MPLPRWSAIVAGAASLVVTACGPAGGGDPDAGFTIPGTITSISSGAAHACELRDDHTIWCWGYANQGQLGWVGGTNPVLESATPGKVS